MAFAVRRWLLRHGAAPIWAAMVIGKILSVLLALALMLAPTAALAGEGAARASSADQAMARSDAGHCSSMSGDGDGREVADKGCCAAGCAGIAIPSPALLPLPATPHMAGAGGMAASLDGLPGELATPPPRRA